MSFSKIDENSLDTSSSSLDLFRTPNTKTSALKGRERVIHPSTNPNGAQIDMEFRTGPFHYWDAEQTRLLVELHVETSTGADIGDEDNAKITPTTNLLHTLFQIVTLSINNHDVSYEANYPHAAYVETLLSRSLAHKKTIGGSFLWHEDDVGVADRADLQNAMAEDIKARKQIISRNKTVQLCDRLHIPFLNQDRYGLPNTTIKLSFTRSNTNLCLLSTDSADTTSYRIVITKCALLVHEVEVNPSIINAHNALLATGNKVMYPLNQVETQMFTISAGKMSERIPVLTNQQGPKRMTVALLDHEGKNGDLSKNPFKFQHYDLRRISLDLDGTPVPAKPIEMNFTSKAFAHAFHNLAMSTGKAHGHGDNGITMEKFGNGYTLFCFDLTPDGCHGADTHLINFNSLTLDMAFGTPLASTISVFVHMERDELLKFDNEKTLEKLPRI